MTDTPHTPTSSPHREDLILRAMADQEQEFSRFRENVSARLTRLEKKPRRSLTDLDPDSLMDYAVAAVLLFFAVRVLMFLVSYFSKQGVKANGYLSMPQA